MTTGIPASGDDKVKMVLAHGPELAALERQFEVTQADVVDCLIEQTCWGDSEASLQALKGNVGTPAQRLAAVRAALTAQAIQ